MEVVMLEVVTDRGAPPARLCHSFVPSSDLKQQGLSSVNEIAKGNLCTSIRRITTHREEQGKQDYKCTDRTSHDTDEA